MRLRISFGIAFVVLFIVTVYLGFSDTQLQINDKFMHFVAFFALTTAFYWIVETSRRRAINATLLVCTLVGGIGSEFLQSVLPYRDFDLYDIVANIAGSSLALLLSTLYHRRMLERKRSARTQYAAVPEGEVDFVGPEVEATEMEPAQPNEEDDRMER